MIEEIFAEIFDRYSPEDVFVVSEPVCFEIADEAARNLSEKRRQYKVVILITTYPHMDVVNIFGVPSFSKLGHYVYIQRPNPLKIAVYAIAKNESQFVETFYTSAKDADYVIIGDTGSTDDTAIKARELGALVYDVNIMPWRFDLARNAVLALIPKDVDVCIPMDLDEKLATGWREEVERLWVKGTTTRFRHRFDWGSGVVFHYEKVHARSGYHWHHPCHEYPRPDPRTVERYAISNMTMITHHPDPTKSRAQYMDLLEVAVAEDKTCPRNAFYYARELTFNAEWERAHEALVKYLDLHATAWSHERAYAMRLLGDCCEKLLRPAEAMKWYRLAVAEAPEVRETWCDLADAHHRRKEWEECWTAAGAALKILKRQEVYTSDPKCWGARPHDLRALAAYKLEMYELAVAHGTLAANFEPQDARLVTNLKLYVEKAL